MLSFGSEQSKSYLFLATVTYCCGLGWLGWLGWLVVSGVPGVNHKVLDESHCV